MRITFLSAAPDMSGGARVVHIYAARLQARGHDVTIVSRPLRTPTIRQRLAARLGGKPVPRPSGDTGHYGNADYAFRMLDTYRPIAEADVPDADVVIATWWETAEWMFRLPPRKGVHVHFVQHYEAFENTLADRVARVLAAPTAKITICRWLEGMLRDEFHNQSVEMIHNSVDMSQFNAPARARNAHPTVGMLYHSVPWKGCATGFAAFALLRQRLPNVRLVTFGSTDPITALPLPEGTTHHTLPRQDEIRHIYARCDVWLCPSTSEGFYLPLLEAMACRCPVVSTPVGGPADLIEQGVNGYLTPIGDAQQMADKLATVLACPPSAWQSMSEAAHDTAARYSWDDAADLFEAALRRAVTSSPQR